MRVIRDIGYVKSRRSAGRVMVGAGLALIGVAFLINVELPQYFLASLAATVAGFFLFYGGLQQVARWSRKPRADEVIDASLARLNDRYAVIHYAELPGKRPDHVLVTPNRLLVMTSRELPGQARVKGRSWRRPGGMLFSLFRLAGAQLGNPTIDNETQVKSLTDFLADEELPGEVEGLVVFVDPRADIEVIDATLPIVHVTELLDYVRDANERGGKATLGSRERDALVEKLARGNELERTVTTKAPPKKRMRAA